MASTQFVASLHDVKMVQAASRAKKLHLKRLQFERASTTSSSGIQVGSGVKPHRAARAVTRTCLARGMIDLQGDMPSIVCRDSTWSRKRAARKPAVAAMVQHQNVHDICDEALFKDGMGIEDVSTADEHSDEEQQLTRERTSSEDASVCARREVFDVISSAGVWPAISASLSLSRKNEVPLDGVPSHREIVIKSMLLDIEEQKSLARVRAKKAAEARAAQEALEWKTVAPKRSRKAKTDKPHKSACQSLSLDVVQPVSIDPDTAELKLMRASTRATNLHIKRSQLWSSCSATSAGRRVGYGVKPHRNVRVATRTCLARGAVDAQEDMPSIVCMDSTWSRKHCARKPAVAPRLRHSDEKDLLDDAGEDCDHWERASPIVMPAPLPSCASKTEEVAVLSSEQAQPLVPEQPVSEVSVKRAGCIVS